MTTDTQPRSKLLRKCIFWGLLLIGIYCGIYWSLAQPGLSIRSGRARSAPRYSENRRTHQMLEWIFWPAYQIDYHLRPGLWQVQLIDDQLQMRIPIR